MAAKVIFLRNFVVKLKVNEQDLYKMSISSLVINLFNLFKEKRNHNLSQLFYRFPVSQRNAFSSNMISKK